MKTARKPRALVVSAACVVLFAGLLFMAASPRPVSAIDIEIELDDCDDAPSWDSSCSILQSHFSRAEAIWEALLTSDEDYSFDFEWDSDISSLALATTGVDDYIEV